MNNAPIWIGSRPNVVCHAFKKYLVLQPWQIAKRIAFRFETVWCIREGDSLVLNTGERIKFATVYTDGKCLVGPDDPSQIAEYNADAIAFRKALVDRTH